MLESTTFFQKNPQAEAVEESNRKDKAHLGHIKSISQERGASTHILVAHVPIRPFSIRHHFPHDDAIAPNVTGGGELPVSDGLWGCPANGDLTSLQVPRQIQ